MKKFLLIAITSMAVQSPLSSSQASTIIECPPQSDRVGIADRSLLTIPPGDEEAIAAGCCGGGSFCKWIKKHWGKPEPELPPDPGEDHVPVAPPALAG
jgi:hypothetical protein